MDSRLYSASRETYGFERSTRTTYAVTQPDSVKRWIFSMRTPLAITVSSTGDS